MPASTFPFPRGSPAALWRRGERSTLISHFAMQEIVERVATGLLTVEDVRNAARTAVLRISIPFQLLRTRKISPFTADRSGSLLLFGRQEVSRQHEIVELDFDLNEHARKWSSSQCLTLADVEMYRYVSQSGK
ncbi:hypothetical protein E3T39_01065 [Cryobacterium suzukii]|uniref:Uncharacterized protein n=1 Tax=Cryobacterium suzukii TaxID=1259198 RepID=A0A4R9AHU6_9MICO|nr:hypothetical protein [Cryobacterium suzukii]TFD62570.1 hypothetical protein E3T39_01065 [Cryobacterium suzukii]